MRALLRIAWRNIGRQGRRSFITAVAMAVGVGMSMAMIALMDGMFVKMFDTLVRQQMGHVQVHDPAWPKQHSLHATMDEKTVLAKLDRVKDAVGVAPRAYGFALLGLKDRSTGARLEGVDPVREAKVTLVRDHMVSGHYLEEGSSHEMILGKSVAETLHAKVGSEIVAVTQAADGSLGNDIYHVAGIYQTGSAMLDRGTAFLTLPDLQSLLVLPGEIHEVALLGPTPKSVPALASNVRSALAGSHLLVQTWAQIDPNAAQVIQMQDGMAWMLLIIVFAVAAFGVLNTMLMSVFERTKELGVLRALGLSPGRIVLMVVFEAAMLASIAGVAGLAFGLLLDGYLVHWGLDLTTFTQGFSWAGVNFDPIMRGYVEPSRIAFVVLALFVVAIASALWPAVRAARLDPVQAMREE